MADKSSDCAFHVISFKRRDEDVQALSMAVLRAVVFSGLA
jgi:hypothetical protein